jgi:hypothetical protein
MGLDISHCMDDHDSHEGGAVGSLEKHLESHIHNNEVLQG